MYGSGGEFTRATRALYSGPAVLLGRKGTIDKPILVDGEFWTVDTMFCAQPYSAVDPRFLYYACTTIPFNMLSTSTALPSMTQGDLNAVRLPDPNYEVQKAIADFLDRETAKIDVLIARQKHLIATLREDRAATITQAVTKGLNPDVEMKDSGIVWLDYVPQHWVPCRLKNAITSITSGTSVNGADVPATSEEVGVLKTSCVSAGQFIPEANKTVVGEDLSRVSCPVTAGTLVVNRANTPSLVGSAGYVSDARRNLYLSDKLWQVSFTSALAEFLYHWTRTAVYRSQIVANCVGASSSMQNLSMTDFRNIAIALPPIAEQQAIVEFLSGRISRSDALIAKSTEMIKTLREYRSALITDAVTGKIDVGAAT